MSFNPIRELHHTPRFKKDLKTVSKKYKNLEPLVSDFFQEVCSNRRNVQGNRIPGANQPVFKSRVPLGDKGKRSGARVIYYCDTAKVVALFIYAKNDKEDIPMKEILTALKAFDLLPP